MFETSWLEDAEAHAQSCEESGQILSAQVIRALVQAVRDRDRKLGLIGACLRTFKTPRRRKVKRKNAT